MFAGFLNQRITLGRLDALANASHVVPALAHGSSLADARLAADFNARSTNGSIEAGVRTGRSTVAEHFILSMAF